MRIRVRMTIVVLAALSLCGCNALEDDVRRGFAQNARFDTPATFTTADVRIITQREHPLLHNTVICTEPSPDVAKALSTALGASAQGGSGSVTAGVGVSGASAEAAAELAGRSTALLGLRDGLYQACQVYANGAIGQDAYALVLSRYAQLMVTLFLGQDITGAAGAEGKALAASAALQAPGAQPSGNAGSAPAPTAAKTVDAAPADPALTAKVAAVMASASGVELPPRFWLAAAAAGAAPAKPAADTPATPAPSKTAATDPGTTPAPSASGVGASPSLVLGRTVEDFFNLDYNLTHLLLVACITEYDPTRFNGGRNPNPFLAPLCQNLTLQKIQDMETEQLKLLAVAPPIRPDVSAAAGQSPGATKPPAASPGPTVDAEVVAVQLALKTQHCSECDPGTADGLAGPATKKAVLAYQKFVNQTQPNSLPENGDPKDRATMAKLGVAAKAGAPPAGAPRPGTSA